MSYCLIFKVQTTLRGELFPRCHISLPHYFLFVNTFLKFFSHQFVLFINHTSKPRKTRQISSCHIILQNFSKLVKRIFQKNFYSHEKYKNNNLYYFGWIIFVPIKFSLKNLTLYLKTLINYNILNYVPKKQYKSESKHRHLTTNCNIKPS